MGILGGRVLCLYIQSQRAESKSGGPGPGRSPILKCSPAGIPRPGECLCLIDRATLVNIRQGLLCCRFYTSACNGRKSLDWSRVGRSRVGCLDTDYDLAAYEYPQHTISLLGGTTNQRLTVAGVKSDKAETIEQY